MGAGHRLRSSPESPAPAKSTTLLTVDSEKRIVVLGNTQEAIERNLVKLSEREAWLKPRSSQHAPAAAESKQVSARVGLAGLALAAVGLVTKLLPESARTNPVVANVTDALNAAAGGIPSYDSYVGRAVHALAEGAEVGLNLVNHTIARVAGPAVADALITRHNDVSAEAGKPKSKPYNLPRSM